MNQYEKSIAGGDRAAVPPVIARFESGRTNPTLDFAARLSSAVGAKLEIRLSK